MDSADNTLKSKLHEIIFGYETLAGKLFDVILISLIAISVIAVRMRLLESPEHARAANSRHTRPTRLSAKGVVATFIMDSPDILLSALRASV